MKLKMTALITGDDGETVGEFFTQILLDEKGIVGNEEEDEKTMEVMTLPLLEAVRDRLGIENPIDRQNRELTEALKSGGPLPDWVVK